MVKTVRYEHENSFEILNPITAQTTQIWICFHGLGYLATFFKRYFTVLNKETCAVIVLQAPSKFYLDTNFKNVGACWLTRVDTAQEMHNNVRYIDAVLKQEAIYGDARLVFMGYSQGVSIATRFLAHYNHTVKALIMHSGSIPVEFNEQTSTHFKKLCRRFIHIVGLQDEYLNEEVVATEKKKLEMLFGTECELYRPDLKHEVAVTLLKELSETL